MENFNKKDYKKLWVNFESSTQAMDLLVILYNIEIFEISLITIESDVNNNVLDLMDNLDWDVEVVFMITNDTFNKNDYTDILEEMFDESSEKLIEDLFLLYAYSKKDHFIYAQTNLKFDEENNLVEGEGIDTYISVTYNIDRFREFLESVIIWWKKSLK